MPTITDDEASTLRGELLAGYASKPELARAFRRHPRTIERWKHELNVPFIKLGNEELLSIQGLRDRLTGKVSVQPSEPKRRGRPRKAQTTITTESPFCA
jgi:hypothetical protein